MKELRVELNEAAFSKIGISCFKGDRIEIYFDNKLLYKETIKEE